MKQHTFLRKFDELAMPIVKACLALAWATFVFAILERPMPVVESDVKGYTVSDKFVHIFLFGFLLWLVLNTIREWPQHKHPLKGGFRGASGGRISRLAYILSVALVFGFAYLCEYLQQFVPTRTSSLADLSFGALGIVLSLWLYLRLHKKCHCEPQVLLRRGNPVVASSGEIATPFSASWRIRARNDKRNKPKLLVHLCCGPCGSALSAELKKDYDVSLFFANSNLDTPKEFAKRAENAEKVAKEYGLPLITEDYDHAEWLDLIKGLEDEPERGGRCLKCYEYRLKQTADKAEELGFDYFTTSLSVSPYKDGQAIIHMGRSLGAKIKPKFLDRHFGSSDGFKKSVAKAKELGLYRQKYCGCEFSNKQGK